MFYNRLKSNYFIPVVLFSINAALSSCEKVIDIDIDDAEKQIVIEASVTNSASQIPTVKISRTKNFNDGNDFDGVTGATVTIQVNNGSIYNLSSTANGVYSTNLFTGVPGSIYLLTVNTNGKTYTASCKMPAEVRLDTTTVNEVTFGASTIKAVYPSYLDPVGKGNSYRLVNIINGVQEKNVYVQNDNLSDGRVITRPLINIDSKIKSGDIVTTELQCIDEPVYLYWYSLEQAATGNNQSATPANPVSNITGGALGVFSAHSVTRKTIVVP